ncbi:hypothetical protein ABH922_001049 [Rhodococcus sp. 27YEA15]
MCIAPAVQTQNHSDHKSATHYVYFQEAPVYLRMHYCVASVTWANSMSLVNVNYGYVKRLVHLRRNAFHAL